MIRRITFSDINNVKRQPLLTVIFLATATALFFLSHAVTTAAVEGTWGEAHTLTGTITMVDFSRSMNSLTLQSSELGLSTPNNEMNILLSGNTVVRMCGVSKSYNDLKAGTEMQVTYHEFSGLAVADFVYKPC